MRKLTFLLIPLLVLACDRQPVAPDVAPTLDIANAPELTGIVLRFDRPFGFYARDPETGLFFTLGVDGYELCSSGAPDIYSMRVARTELVDRFVLNVQGTSVPTQVWFMPAGIPTCDDILSSQPIATGESEVFSQQTGNAQNTAQAIWGAHGILDNGVFHFFWHQSESQGVINLSVTLR